MNIQTNDIIEDIGDIKNLRNKLMTVGITTILLAIFASDIKEINFLFIKFKDGHDIFSMKTIGCIVFANFFFLWRYYQKFRLLDFQNDKHVAIEILKAKMKSKIEFLGGVGLIYENGKIDRFSIKNFTLKGTVLDFTSDRNMIISKGLGDLMGDRFGLKNLRVIDSKEGEDSMNNLPVAKQGKSRTGKIKMEIEESSVNGGLDKNIELYFRDGGCLYEWIRLKSVFTDSKYMDYLVPLFVPVIAICMLLGTKIFII